MAWYVTAGGKYYVKDYVYKDGKKKIGSFGGYDYASDRDNKIRELETQKSKNRGNHVDYSATIWEFCNKYLALRATRRDNTKRIILNAIDKIEDYFKENVRLTDLTGDMVEEFVKHLQEKFNHTTTHMHMRTFRGILNLAVKKRILDENPSKEPIAMLGEPPGREVYLTEDEKQRLYAAAMQLKFRKNPNANIELLKAIKIFLNTGVRRAELVNMAKEHMVSDYEILIPSRSNRNYGHLKPTKSKKPYVLPLNTEIMPFFHEIKEGRIFKEWTEDSIERRFRKAADAAGLPDLTPHGLRHTFASDFLKKGGKLEELQEMLNHSTMAMARKYAHFEKGRLKERVDAMVAPSVKLAIA